MPIRAAILLATVALSARVIAGHPEVIDEISRAAEAEVRSGAVSGVTIALVAEKQIISVRGFGFADKRKRIPADAKTVYRAGSISKLFTAIAAMQLAEQGRLDIDKPVGDYLPEFHITVPFAGAQPITLRQLMCHRAGMVRESPVGSYFDDSEPGMERTVASLASCVLVHPPGTKTKYSNSGVTVAGLAVERVSGLSFETWQQRHILRPLGLTNSSFLRDANIRSRLAIGYLPVAQANGGFREIPAPVFELGTLAAGNLYTTAEDLARFLVWLLDDAAFPTILKRQTLAEMFTPQLNADTNGFGLGFSVNHHRGRKTVSHTGAVYGFTSSFTAVPVANVGVVVLSNDDMAIGPVRALSQRALDLLLGLQPPSEKAIQTNFPPAALSAFAGDYESQSFWARVDAAEGRLVANISGQMVSLTPTAALRFEANGRIAHQWPVVFERDERGDIGGFATRGQKFIRVRSSEIPRVPDSWKPLLGAYGPDFIPLIISVKHGRLYAMTENEFDYRLTPVNNYVFGMPPGLYEDEQLVFQADRKGRVHTAILANMPLRRR